MSKFDQNRARGMGGPPPMPNISQNSASVITGANLVHPTQANIPPIRLAEIAGNMPQVPTPLGAVNATLTGALGNTMPTNPGTGASMPPQAPFASPTFRNAPGGMGPFAGANLPPMMPPPYNPPPYNPPMRPPNDNVMRGQPNFRGGSNRFRSPSGYFTNRTF